MPFKKGQSGNPGGRPKELQDVQGLARSHAPEAVKVLISVARNGKTESARVTAAVALLDRAYGKPSQTIDATVRHIDPNALSDAELGTYIGGNRSPDNTPAPGDTAKLN